jgi:hypothetical protein
MKAFITGVVLALGTIGFVGCASSHEEGVKSNLRTQWTMVAADTMATTDAAKAVLSDRGYKNVSGDSDKDVGTAKGKMSDGTEVSVSIKKDGTGSQVSVTVGVMGSPTLGAEIAAAIKAKATGMPAKPM